MQMSPLGDRLLVKPEEEAQVYICFDLMSLSCIATCAHIACTCAVCILYAYSAVEAFVAACLPLLCLSAKLSAKNVFCCRQRQGVCC